jgi:hypothetical protein
VVIGAATNTSAKIAASLAGGNGNMKPTFEEWLLAKGFGDAASLTELQKAGLNASYMKETAEDPANKPNPTPVMAGAAGGGTPTIDPIQASRERAASEFERQGKVQEIAAKYPTIVARAIREGRDEEWTKTQVELAELRASRPTGPAIHAGAPTGVTHDPLVIEAAVAMATNLPNIGARFTDQTLEAAKKTFTERISLHQILLEAANRNGYDGRHFKVTRGNIGSVLQAAFSTIEVSGILSNTANKHLIDAFNAVDQTWKLIAARSPVSDFKEVTHYALTGDLKFEEVGADGELKHGTLGELSYSNKARTYGRILSITRQDIINDDLGAFARIPAKLGRGSALKVNEVFWKEFFADNGTFYTTARKNYATGAGTALSISAIGAGLALWMTQKDADKNPLGTKPSILLVTPTDYLNAKTYAEDANIQGSTAAAPTRNPIAGENLKVVTSPYMSDSEYGNSTTHWFLIANPSDIPLIEFVSLDGAEEPVIETAEADFNTLGIQMRGYYDFGVKKQEYRAGQKQKGAA